MLLKQEWELEQFNRTIRIIATITPFRGLVWLSVYILLETAFQSFYCSNKFSNNVYYNIILSNKQIYVPNRIPKIKGKDKEYQFKKLVNNNYRCINIKQGSHILSFFIENHRKYGNCIVIFNTNEYYGNGDIGYNVYSIDKDKWLLKKNLDTKFDTDGARALLFDQTILIVSHQAKLYFFSLANLKNPTCIGMYNLSWVQYS